MRLDNPTFFAWLLSEKIYEVIAVSMIFLGLICYDILVIVNSGLNLDKHFFMLNITILFGVWTWRYIKIDEYKIKML